MNDHAVQKMDLPRHKKKIMLYRMKGYGQFCPVALAAEVFAERWTPLILRELLSGARRFADIQRGVPRISRNLLCQRLDTLAHIGIIERKPLPHATRFRISSHPRRPGVRARH